MYLFFGVFHLDIKFHLHPIEVFMSSIPVSTLAESMMQDAWDYFSTKKSSDKVVILNNADIRRLSEVREGCLHSIYKINMYVHLRVRGMYMCMYIKAMCTCLGYTVV